jgi:hypothetical protein
VAGIPAEKKMGHRNVASPLTAENDVDRAASAASTFYFYAWCTSSWPDKELDDLISQLVEPDPRTLALG